jgi:two-component system response regulator (stage 0 sporulation protein F)
MSPLHDRTLVLVVDDDDNARDFVVSTLHDAGCATLEAHDGSETLDMLERASVDASVRPDVLVADVKMPGCSGLGVLATLRRAGWPLPVILMTVLSDESIRTVAMRLGAASVLRKPFDPEDLMSAVRQAQRAPAAARYVRTGTEP